MSRFAVALFPLNSSFRTQQRQPRYRCTGSYRKLLPVSSLGLSVSSIVNDYDGTGVGSMVSWWVSLPFAESPEYAPVLNVPAFASFAIIAVVFGLLQWRIRAIESAVVERREALAALRNAKAWEISNGGGDESYSSSKQAQEALNRYRTAYDTVETLMQIAPGVRIRAPMVTDQDNRRAAQQFLGVDLEEVNEDTSSSDNNSIAPKMAAGILFVIGLSQLALLIFLVSSQDPFQTLW
jgi:hypothetical protein